MQAARGTSLNPPGDHDTDRPTRLRLFIVVAVVAYVLDQVTKVLAVEMLQGREPVELPTGVLSLTFLRNPGAAFGMGASMTIVLSGLALLVCLYVVRISSKLRDAVWAVGLGLLLSGAIGNLTDRVFREPRPFRGHVVDFIDYGPFVGNVADIALTVAAVLIVFRTWRGFGIDGRREAKR